MEAPNFDQYSNVFLVRVNKVLVLVHICEGTVGLFLFKLVDRLMPRSMLDVSLPEKRRRGTQKTR